MADYEKKDFHKGPRKPSGDRRPSRYEDNGRGPKQTSYGRGDGENRRPERPSKYRGQAPRHVESNRPAYGKKPYGQRNNSEERRPRRNYEEEERFVETEDIRESEESIHGTMENSAVIGRNAVRELLRSGRSIDKMWVQKGQREGSIVMLVAEATERGIPVIETEKSRLDEMAGFVPHQGVIAMAAEKEYCSVEDILDVAAERGEKPLIVIADGLTDPYNLGAVIRCAEGAGAHGVIIPKRRAVGLTPLVAKASAGALEHMPVAKVSNISQTIAALKEKGIWVYAAEAGGTDYDRVDYTTGCAIVMGSEGNGVSDLVKKTCDDTVSIPMYGQVNSFNVSTAAAVLLCEASRQRHKK